MGRQADGVGAARGAPPTRRRPAPSVVYSWQGSQGKEVQTALSTTEKGSALVSLTPKAAAKIRDLLAAKNRSDLALRIYITAGGCSGFSYGMAWDAPAEDDHLLEQEGVRVIVDPMSAAYLEGAEVDFSDQLMGGGFMIRNPNAASTCGCGQSFRTSKEGGSPHSCSCH
jgi:iron-sulfur cluster assembly protein